MSKKRGDFGQNIKRVVMSEQAKHPGSGGKVLSRTIGSTVQSIIDRGGTARPGSVPPVKPK